MVVVDDSGINAGALMTGGGYRISRSQEIALQQKLPFVHLVESAGGDLMNYTVEGFSEGGRLFGSLAKLSKAGIPVISILHGSSTAGGAYMPGLSDYVIGGKRKRQSIFSWTSIAFSCNRRDSDRRRARRCRDALKCIRFRRLSSG